MYAMCVVTRKSFDGENDDTLINGVSDWPNEKILALEVQHLYYVSYVHGCIASAVFVGHQSQ